MSGFRTQRLRRWLRMLKENPMQALEACKEEIGGDSLSANEEKYQQIGLIVDYTRHLMTSPKMLHELRMHEFWRKDGYLPKASQIALMATRFVCNAKEGKGPRYQQSLAWSKVVEYCIAKQMKADEVFDFLCEATIYGALRLAAMEAEAEADEDTLPSTTEDTPRPSLAVSDLNTRDAPNETEINKSDDKEESDTDDGDYDAKARTIIGSNETKQRRRKTIDLDEQIAIDPGDHWEVIMSLRKGEHVDIRVYCTKDTGFKRYRAGYDASVRRVRRDDD